MKLDPKLQAQLGEMFKPIAPGALSSEAAAPQLRMVEVEVLRAGPQPRTRFDENELRDLENSIGELSRAGQGIGGSGILQPLLARALPDGALQIVAGERRLRAARAAGVARVPVVVGADLSQQEAFGQAIVENLLRADLSPLEEARALQQWMNDGELSLRVAAQKLGRDKGYLENRLRLLSMREDVQNMVLLRKDTLPHARLIDAVGDRAQRQKLIEMVVENGAGKREIEAKIARYERLDGPSFRKDTSAEPGELAEQNAGEEPRNSRRDAALSVPVQGAWKALQKASDRLQGNEAIRLAERLEKLAARLRKTASAR